jgi:hypothetical protein
MADNAPLSQLMSDFDNYFINKSRKIGSLL